MKTAEQIFKEQLDRFNQLKDRQPSTDSEHRNHYTCRGCDKEWSLPTKALFDGRYSSECEACSEKRRVEKFGLVCPALYQDTDIGRLLVNQLNAAMKWEYGSRGLIFLGETGKGKTRVAWTLLKRIMTQDKPERKMVWFDCIGFGHEMAKHYKLEDAEEWLEKMAAVELMFFDDLGKLKMTERAETELFGLIERRCAAKLPIIVTTNDTGDSLAARMTDNRGPALIRRLREFCEPIQF